MFVRNVLVDYDCGWCIYGCLSGQKGFIIFIWFKDVVELKNVVLLLECEVQRIFFLKNYLGIVYKIFIFFYIQNQLYCNLYGKYVENFSKE